MIIGTIFLALPKLHMLIKQFSMQNIEKEKNFSKRSLGSDSFAFGHLTVSLIFIKNWIFENKEVFFLHHGEQINTNNCMPS